MKTPTIEQVKEHFKDAKIVRCLFSGTESDITRPKYDIEYLEGDYWITPRKHPGHNLELWSRTKGYAEIIETKTQKLEFPCEMFSWNDEKGYGDVATIYGIFQGQYLAKYDNGCFHSYKNAEPVKKDVSEWTADDIKTVDDAIEHFEHKLENKFTNTEYTEYSKDFTAVKILINEIKKND